jgi:hypothetical protein
MQVMVAHFCDEMIFFPWVLFIEMLVVINIFLDLLIGTRSKLTTSLWKELRDYLLIKKFIC